MKAKTARRFLNRNAIKLAKHQRGQEQKPSFLKRWKRAAQDCFKD